MEWNSSTAEHAGALTTEQITRWIRDASGEPDLQIAIERVMPVAFGIGLAARFREGDVFLVGDAAHRVTPRGGTGLNTAIRDGFDIGWKLAWVLRGWAHERLLESYERERRPVAEFNTERSSRADGSILDTAVGLNADIGGRIAHVWVPRDGRLVSTLDLLGEGLTLFIGPDANDDVPSGEAGSPPVTTVRLDAIAARGLGLSTGGIAARQARRLSGPASERSTACGAQPAAAERAVELVAASGREVGLSEPGGVRAHFFLSQLSDQSHGAAGAERKRQRRHVVADVEEIDAPALRPYEPGASTFHATHGLPERRPRRELGRVAHVLLLLHLSSRIEARRPWQRGRPKIGSNPRSCGGGRIVRSQRLEIRRKIAAPDTAQVLWRMILARMTTNSRAGSPLVHFVIRTSGDTI